MFFAKLLPPLWLMMATLCGAYTDPLPCSGICTDTHDPSLIRRSADGTYYRFATGGLIPIYSAASVQGPWRHLGNVLSAAAKVDNPGKGDLWAPDVHSVNDSYILFYSASTFGNPTSAIGYATSASLDPGTWTDHGVVLASSASTGYNAIDANLITPELLGFGSFYGGLYQVALGGQEENYQPSGTAYNVGANRSSGNAVEGSFTFRYGDDWYLLFSAGQCCNIESDPPPPGGEYKIMVCRGSSATGPFVDQKGTSCASGGGTIVLQSHGTVYGPGGQGVWADGNTWYLYYHYMDTNIGKGDGDVQWGVNVINWSSGWPTV